MTASDGGAAKSQQTRQDLGWELGLLPSEVTLILYMRSCVYAMCVYVCVYMCMCVSTPAVLSGESHEE